MRTLKHALLASLLAGAALIPVQSQAFFGWLMPWNWGGWNNYDYPYYYGPYGYGGYPYGYGGYPYGVGAYAYPYYAAPYYSYPVAPTAPRAAADK